MKVLGTHKLFLLGNIFCCKDEQTPTPRLAAQVRHSLHVGAACEAVAHCGIDIAEAEGVTVPVRWPVYAAPATPFQRCSVALCGVEGQQAR